MQTARYWEKKVTVGDPTGIAALSRKHTFARVPALDLLQGLSLSLRHTAQYKEESDDADARIQPESPGGTERRV
jgi:hypothetical protein